MKKKVKNLWILRKEMVFGKSVSDDAAKEILSKWIRDYAAFSKSVDDVLRQESTYTQNPDPGCYFDIAFYVELDLINMITVYSHTCNESNITVNNILDMN